MKRSEFLMDVVAIRLFLIFFLIFYHSFAIYTGGWGTPFEGFRNDIPLYYWMGYLSHGFQLQAMVFISGLLFGYTIHKYPERLCFNSCVVKKAKRILLPSLLFSAVYYLMFYDTGKPWHEIVYELLNGCGHLWFLPMLFWCFVCCYLIVKKSPPPHQHSNLILIVAVAMNLLSFGIPFRIGSMMSYFVYFYLGYAVRQGSLNLQVKKTSSAFILIAVYLILAVAGHFLQGIAIHGFWDKMTLLFCMRLLQLAGAVSMVTAVYSLANKASLQAKLKQNDFLITLSGYCYGVYIYQQFILKYLYYQTPLPYAVSAEILPWLGLVVTLAFSLLFCHLTLKTKFGRYLIG